jgi:SecD/SecF fusion protein
MGGAGIHGFAFSFLVGVIFGCYSSVYIAAPVLLWLSGSSSSMSKEIASPNMGSATPAMSR